LRPLVDYSPSYTNLLGYPISLIVELFGASSATLILSHYWALLGAACWLLSIGVIREVLRCRLVWAGVLAVVLLSITASGTNPIVSFPGGNSNIRISLSILTFFCFLKALNRDKPALGRLLVLGVLSGLTVVNYAEFGLTAVVAMLSGICIWTLWGGLPKRVLLVLFVSVAATTTILFFAIGGGNLMSTVSTYFLWSTSRSSGGYTQIVPLFGIHIVATVSHGLAAILGWRVVRKKESNQEMQLLGVFGLISAIWGGLTLPFYLGSATPNFGGPLWLPLAFSLMSLIANSLSARNATPMGQSYAPINRTQFQVSGINQVVTAFLVCALTAVPNVQITLDRWMDDHWSLDRAVGLEEDEVLQAVKSRLQASTGSNAYAYYGEYANLFQLSLGIPAVYGTHDPMIAYTSRSTVKATRRTISSRRPLRVLASSRYLPEQFKRLGVLEGPCPGMRRVDSRDEDLLIEYVYKPSD